MYILHEENNDSVNGVFSILGFCYLFPYWALAQPVDYWHLYFSHFNIEFDISWIYSIASVLTLFFILFCLGNMQKPHFRILGGLFIQILVLTLLPILPLLPIDHFNDIIVCTVLVAIATSFLDSSVFGLASLYPKGAMQHVQLGMGISGLFAAIFRLISKAIFPGSMIQLSTTVYFIAGALTVAMAIPAYLKLLSHPLSQKIVHATPQERFLGRKLWAKVWLNQFLLALSYALTLIVYPGILSSIPSFQIPSLNEHAWWPLILLTTYTVMEVIGRYVAKWTFGLCADTIWRIIVPRLALLPPLICAAKGIYFTNDVFVFLLVCILGISNGYCGTLVIEVVNEKVDVNERSATGMLSSVSINVGLIVGASLSYGIAKWLQL